MELYEQKLLLTMARRLKGKKLPWRRRAGRDIAETLCDMAGPLGLDIDTENDSLDQEEGGEVRHPKSEVMSLVTRRIHELCRCHFSPLERRVRMLGQIYDLDEIETDILGFYYRYKNIDEFESLLDSIGYDTSNGSRSLRIIAVALGHSPTEVSVRLGPNNSLVSCGFLDTTPYADRITEAASGVLGQDLASKDTVCQWLIGPEQKADLNWTDFDHLSRDRDRILSLINAAVKVGRPAIHVLLYGPSGTGKSQLAKVLAAKLGCPIHAIGESNRYGEELERKGRLSYYRMAQKLAGRQQGRILLVDEADDLLGANLWSPFASALRTAGSKAHLHKLLETTGAPTIWTTNSISWIDPAILRRMTFALEVKAPSTPVLTEIWQREGKRRGVKIGRLEAESLAEQFDVAPGLVTGALGMAELTGGGIDDLRASVASIVKAMNGGQIPNPPPIMPAPFVPSLACADTDLVALTERVAASGEKAVSFCLYGAPGTGKTSFARHLAERLGLRLVQKRASDLISKWVGDTEKLIADAFAESRERGTLLMFDEADSLLRDRASADRRWEISQVNEMLTWMESHPYPFVCATNLMEGLDSAALRRFVFKVQFDWLGVEECSHAFRHFFHLEPPRELNKLDRLAPGDFSVVLRKAKILALQPDPAMLLGLLASEMAAKPGNKKSLGFDVAR